MRVVMQRVKRARVEAGGRALAEIGMGMVLLVGLGRDDGNEDIGRMADKIAKMRVFEDGAGKMSLSIKDAGGEVLSVPQFTLYADTKKGNRPCFKYSQEPGKAKKQWGRFDALLREAGLAVKEGVFGAHMEVELVNDGPVTIVLDSRNQGAFP